MTTDLRYRINNLEVLDCGDPEGLRYEVSASETHPDDTGHVALVHVASCFNREMAELIVNALRAYHDQASQPLALLESIARVIASCRERGLTTPDLIAGCIATELSNYADIAGEFERIYGSFARCQGVRP